MTYEETRSTACSTRTHRLFNEVLTYIKETQMHQKIAGLTLNAWVAVCLIAAGCALVSTATNIINAPLPVMEELDNA